MQLTPLLGEEQQLLFEHAAGFLRGRLAAFGSERASPTAIAALWEEAVQLQWLTVCLPPVPPEPPNFRTACSMAEAIGYTGAQLPFVAAALAGWLMHELPIDVQAADLLAAQIEGRTLVVPALGDPAARVSRGIVYQPAGGGLYELKGVAPLVEFADVANRLLVAARSRAGGSPAVFLLSSAASGLEVTTQPTSGGDYACEVRFESVAAEPPLIEGEAAEQALHRLRLHGAALRAAELAGIGWAALEVTLDYARKRTQFGRPIASFQAVHHHFADMLRELTATRLLVAQAAARLDSGRPAEREVWMAKAKASEAIPALLRLAHQITGGAGFYADYPLEGYHRRAIDAQASYGNALACRRRLAGLLQDDPQGFCGPDAHQPRAEIGAG